ncbi:MAG: sel1 repeat family protein [Ruminococcus sp.]|nr:sel1 repeat family protein [Ruminococcus sp.]
MKTVCIIYDSKNFYTTITIDGVPFDTARIDGIAIEIWTNAFTRYETYWDGIFKELAQKVRTDTYAIVFSGDNTAFQVLRKNCPKNVHIQLDVKADISTTNSKNADANTDFFFKLVDENKLIEPKFDDTLGEKMEYFYKVIENNTATIQDYLDFFLTMKILAEKGDSDAQFHLGFCYQYGCIIRPNYLEAAKWYEKAAKQGDANGQYFLGCCYKFGEGVEPDEKQAITWFRKAAA